jgi:quinohemoprotein ethanol dehydrogenase
MDNAVNLSFQLAEPKAGTGALVAWNAATQKEVWRVTLPHFWNGGTMATAGDLVFQGRAEGSFDAYDSASGKRLWSFQAGTGVIAPPITYQVKGHQYITVLSGYGTSGAGYSGMVASLGWQYRTQPRRILTFSLSGAAGPLPPPHPVFAKPIADSQFKPDSELAQKGAMIYGRRCAVCHGVDTKAAGLAPDLRESPIPQDAMAFEAIVYKGALVANGMPSFKELTDQDLAALRQFLRMAADDLRRTSTQGDAPAVPGRR